MPIEKKGSSKKKKTLNINATFSLIRKQTIISERIFYGVPGWFSW